MGIPTPRLSTLHKWRRALEAAGVIFIEPDDRTEQACGSEARRPSIEFVTYFSRHRARAAWVRKVICRMRSSPGLGRPRPLRIASKQVKGFVRPTHDLSQVA